MSRVGCDKRFRSFWFFFDVCLFDCHLLEFLCTRVKNQLISNIKVNRGTLILFHGSVCLMPAPSNPVHCDFIVIVELGSANPSTAFFFRIVVAVFGSSHYKKHTF